MYLECEQFLKALYLISIHSAHGIFSALRCVMKRGHRCLSFKDDPKMKADITDAPQRFIRTRHSRSHFNVVICVVIGSAAAIVAFQFSSRISTLGSVFNRATSSTESDENSTRAGGIVQRQALDSSWLRASDRHLSANSARQTKFDDQNYIPRGADNVVALRAAHDLSSDGKAPEKVKLTIVRQSPSFKDRTCWPYRQGSIESRNCRASVGLKYRE